jgi:hypothetical protein
LQKTPTEYVLLKNISINKDLNQKNIFIIKGEHLRNGELIFKCENEELLSIWINEIQKSINFGIDIINNSIDNEYFNLDFKKRDNNYDNKNQTPKLENFEIITKISNTSNGGSVIKVKNIHDQKFYVMKAIQLEFLIKQNMISYTKSEESKITFENDFDDDGFEDFNNKELNKSYTKLNNNINKEYKNIYQNIKENKSDNKNYNNIYIREYSHKSKKLNSFKRCDFTETLFWCAGIQTDDNGEAEINFNLSDSITCFRILADTFTNGSIGSSKILINYIQIQH